jgi:hypothetical protein
MISLIRPHSAPYFRLNDSNSGVCSSARPFLIMN